MYSAQASVRERNVAILIKCPFAMSALSGEMLVNPVDVQETRVWRGRSLVEREGVSHEPMERFKCFNLLCDIKTLLMSTQR